MCCCSAVPGWEMVSWNPWPTSFSQSSPQEALTYKEDEAVRGLQTSIPSPQMTPIADNLILKEASCNMASELRKDLKTRRQM